MLLIRMMLGIPLVLLIQIWLVGCTEYSAPTISDLGAIEVGKQFSPKASAPQTPGVPQRFRDIVVPLGMNHETLTKLVAEASLEALHQFKPVTDSLVNSWRQQGLGDAEINKKAEELSESLTAQVVAIRDGILAEKFEAWKQEDQK